METECKKRRVPNDPSPPKRRALAPLSTDVTPSLLPPDDIGSITSEKGSEFSFPGDTVSALEQRRHELGENMRLQRLEREKAMRRELVDLRRKLTTASHNNKQLQIEIDKERESRRTQAILESKKLEQLNSKTEFLFSSDQRNQALVEKQKLQLEELTKKYGDEGDRLRLENQSLHSEAKSVKELWRSEVSELREQLDMVQGQQDTSAKWIDSLEEERDLTKKELARYRKQGKQLQTAQAHLEQERKKVRELTHRLEMRKEQDAVMRGQVERVTAGGARDRELRAAKEELARMRRDVENLDLLKEKLTAAEGALERVNITNTKLLQESARANDGSLSSDRWSQILLPILSEASTPETCAQAIMSLQKRSAQLLAEQGEASLAQKQAERSLEVSQRDLKVSQDELESVQARVHALEGEVGEKTALALQATRARDRYKDFLDSIDQEDSLANRDAARVARVQALEIELAERPAKTVAMENKIKVLQTEKRRLEKLLGEAERDAALLEAKLGTGDFNRRTTKVLHFSMNPEKKAKQELAQSKVDRLAHENALLKERLAEVEQVLADRAARTQCTRGR